MNNKDLGVVCCYFNPFRYKTKYLNFLKFHSSLKIQGINPEVIELSYGYEDHQLPTDIKSTKVFSSQVLWHKENLLNIGINKLISKGYENIAWMDSDVIFRDSHWIDDTINCLKNYNLCQLFSVSESESINSQSSFSPSCVKEWSYTGSLMPTSRKYQTGYAWACKSKILSQCMLYDKAIIGGGDSLIWLASFSNKFKINEIIKNHPISYLDLNSYVLDYLEWANLWGALVDGKVSYINHGIINLCHGNPKNRRYISRYENLSKCNYNPTQDIHYENNILKTTNLNLHKLIINYFKNRNEDQFSFFNNIIKNINRKNELLSISQ